MTTGEGDREPVERCERCNLPVSEVYDDLAVCSCQEGDLRARIEALVEVERLAVQRQNLRRTPSGPAVWSVTVAELQDILREVAATPPTYPSGA